MERFRLTDSMQERLSLWLVFVFLMPLIGCREAGQVKNVNPPQGVVETISKALSQKAIGRIEILQIPPGFRTMARVTPEMLEQQYHNKLIIRDAGSTAYWKQMVDALKSVSVQPRDQGSDLRWGVIFYSHDDTRVGAIYFDKFGNGAINDTPVSFQGNFFAWLQKTFSDCFQ